MNRVVVFKRFAVNRYMLAIMVCSALSLVLVVAIWWYYDTQLYNIQHEIDKQKQLHKNRSLVMPLKELPENMNVSPRTSVVRFMSDRKILK